MFWRYNSTISSTTGMPLMEVSAWLRSETAPSPHKRRTGKKSEKTNKSQRLVSEQYSRGDANGGGGMHRHALHKVQRLCVCVRACMRACVDTYLRYDISLYLTHINIYTHIYVSDLHSAAHRKRSSPQTLVLCLFTYVCMYIRMFVHIYIYISS